MRLCLIALAASLLPGALPAQAADDTPAPRWETAIRAFEEADREQPPPEKPLLFTGSSSARLWPVEEVFAEYDALNRGFGGSTFSDLNVFFDRVVLAYRPRAVVVYSGDNDVAMGRDAAETFSDFLDFADRIATNLPEVPLLVLAIKPSNARWALWPVMAEVNEKMAAYAEANEHAVYIDTATPMLGADGTPDADLLQRDRLHLNETGYRVWEGIVRPYLAALDGDDGAE